MRSYALGARWPRLAQVKPWGKRGSQQPTPCSKGSSNNDDDDDDDDRESGKEEREEKGVLT